MECTFKFSSLNFQGFKTRNYSYLRKLYREVDFMLLQETWLYDYEFDLISKELPGSNHIAKSSMLSNEYRDGRPFGGVSIVWKSNSNFSVDLIDTISDRLVACKVVHDNFKFILVNAYMPTNASSNNYVFNDVLYEIMSISFMYNSYNMILGGYFNCQVLGQGLIYSEAF